MRQWAKLGLLVLAAVVVAQLLVQRAAPPLAEGGPAPALVLPDLGGRQVSLEALRGQVVVVNFWATWCGPCRAELPGLAAFWRARRPGCVELLGVVEESARRDVETAAETIPYPVLWDDRAAAASAWKVTGYPRTYLVDPEGRVRATFQGTVERAELERAVASLLAPGCGEGR